MGQVHTIAAGGRSDIKGRFERLTAEWKNATKYSSSITEIATHPAYQQIIGMGPDAVPMILSELRLSPGQWFWALKAITGEDPVAEEDRGHVGRMADSWLRWAEQHGYA